MGKILHNRGLNRGLRITLQQAWCTVKEVKVKNLGSNIFMFKFAPQDEKRSIMAGGPWHLDRALTVLKEPSGIGNITKQSFLHVSFWVQIRNVPLMCRAISTIWKMREKIRNIEEVANTNGECLGEIVRIRKNFS